MLYLFEKLFISCNQCRTFLPSLPSPSNSSCLKMPKSPRPSTTSSQNLTLHQKQHILMHYNAQKALNPPYSQQDLADWTTETYQLSYTPSRSTITQDHPPEHPRQLSTIQKKTLLQHRRTGQVTCRMGQQPTKQGSYGQWSSDQAARANPPSQAQFYPPCGSAACLEVL